VKRELSLSQLTTELTDFLGLPADLDLPRVREVSCTRTVAGDWRVEAHLDERERSDPERYEAAAAWASLSGGVVEVSEPYPSAYKPSGKQRSLVVRIAVAGVPVKIYGYVDSLFTAPQPKAVAS
jgi:hypothetical protein